MVQALGDGSLPGQTLGHYRLLEKIGVGGMGEVYRAHDEHLARDVAIKVLPPGTLADNAARKRFRREALALSRLNHPNIATVHDFDTKGDLAFLVMEYVAGVTLSEKTVKPLPEKEVIRLGAQLAEGLAAAHAEGVIHRDLKPKNLRLTPDGRLKILDFGLAKLQTVTEQAETESLTETEARTAAGTLPYMAPEQLRGEPIDARTDVWAAGIVLYEAATGRRPFLERVSTATADAILHKPTPIPSAGHTRLSPGLEAVILKCLEKDPELRYQSAKELHVDLERLRGESASAQLLARRKLRLPWKKVVAAALVVVALGVLTYFTVARWATKPAERMRVAVLPFTNKTGNPQLEQVGSVLTMTLLHDLTGSPSVRVLPYERLLEITRGLKGNGKEVSGNEVAQIVASYSNSQYVVMPTMFHIGNTLRIDAEIRDARTNETVAMPKCEHSLSGSAEETLYSMIGELGNGIQEYFRKVGPSVGARLRPEISRTKTVSVALDWEQGTKAFARGNYGDAVRAFERAVAEDPGFALAYAWLGRIYGILGYDERALDLSQKAAAKIVAQTPVIDAYFIDANLYERRYDFASAERKYLELIRLYPDDPTWHDSLAAVYEKQGKLKEAIESESAALSKDPQYITAYRNLAGLYTRVSDYPHALQNAQQALKLSSALGDHEGVAEAQCVLGSALWQKGDNAGAENAFRAALAAFESLGNESGVVRAYKLLGDVAANQGNLDDALRFYQKSLSLSREIQNNRIVAVALMNSASVYQLQGKYEEAADYYHRSLDTAERFRDDRRRAEILSNLGSLLISHGSDPGQGLKYVQEAHSLFAQSGDKGFELFADMLSGTYHCNTGDYANGTADLQRALDLAVRTDAKPDLISINYNLGRCRFQQNQYGLARDSAQRALELARGINSPYDIARVQFLLGRVQLRLGGFKDSETTLAAALEDARKNRYQALLPAGYLAQGELDYERGRFDSAEKDCRSAAAAWTGAMPDIASVESRVLLGWIVTNKGTIPQALSDCQTGLKQAQKMGRPSLQAQARLCLARAQLRQKNFAAALEVLADVPAQNEAVMSPELLAQAWYVQSQVLRGLGKKDDAERALERSKDILRRLQQTLPDESRSTFAARRDLQTILR